MPRNPRISFLLESSGHNRDADIKKILDKGPDFSGTQGTYPNLCEDARQVCEMIVSKASWHVANTRFEKVLPQTLKTVVNLNDRDLLRKALPLVFWDRRENFNLVQRIIQTHSPEWLYSRYAGSQLLVKLSCKLTNFEA
jgi:hypothetical protein